ncbi:MAG: hypothetical protein IPO52_15545 [Gemmatimonadetes bacterium]|nr:hypothetical protein [Gemmatimonadota bacterium]MBK9550468.1 hypothetical protein [Gemmatimonadota bacterium]
MRGSLHCASARALALLALMSGGAVAQVAAQAEKYPRMATIGEYQMDERAEIELARSAAPNSVARDATILVLGPQGYRTAVEGTNGFVCMVARSWMAAFDWPEFWNPKVRAADCMNRQAARTILPVVLLRSRMLMAGKSKAEILTAVKAAFTNGEVPELQGGAMSYMMSRSAYLTDEGTHNAPHVMFFTAGVDAKDWGSNAADSPLMAAPYWFFSSTDASAMQGLPPIVVFLIGAANWSDGTPAQP